MEFWLGLRLPFCGSEGVLLEAGLCQSALPSWIPTSVWLVQGVGREQGGNGDPELRSLIFH